MFMPVAAIPQSMHPASAAPLPGDLAAASPPRNILLQVFRI